ncbi:MAG: hypothetical protein HC924_03550 [Synechococcaceae cyanobacterium SM2_3_2]|nr:hypothetical protein [Synechococcaceae cyanobacterium SM2_3_2]
MGILIVMAGSRGLVLLGGGLVSAGMMASWLRQIEPEGPSANLLVAEVFQTYLRLHQALIPAGFKSTWDAAVEVAQEAQASAASIGERCPDVISDLLQVLYGMVALLEQIARSGQALDQVETAAYRQMTQERIQASLQGLQKTQAQLQTLQDQVVLSALDPAMSGHTVSLPLRLQDLVSMQQDLLHNGSSPSPKTSPD